jgi:LacI family transcriptional regulator
MAAVCKAQGLPLVDLNDAPVLQGVPKIRPDNVALGHLAAEHFLERGFRNFGFCGFGNSGWSCERRDGFAEALQLAGRRCAVHDVDFPGEVTPFWNEEQVHLLATWLDRLPKPAAIMACNDPRALQVIAAAERGDLMVPEEVAVLGANNDAVRCELSYPPLSSVATNPFQAGFRAAEILASLMAGQPLAVVDVRVEPVGVVTRHSTDVLSIEDKPVAAALGFIREHAYRGIGVADVVRHAAASRSLLEKRFRRVIGRSPQAEIRRVQVARIRQLLLETDFPLKKIAELTGFEHVEYMSVVFKKLVGASPGGFRKRRQKQARF